ncbi:MAG TPA: Sec-independent protein translocase protein TatB [Gallionella sp.]|nr:Sec-independent protein translocase protein TatB [Gallionella sp.]
MFDIAFSELVVILLVALIVIGPEKLPKVARTLGLLWGKVQRFVTNVKTDIKNDIALEEAKKMHDRIIQEVDSAGRTLQEDGRTLQQQILQARYQEPAETPAAPAPSAEPVAKETAGTETTPGQSSATGGEQAPAGAPAVATGKPDENVNKNHS